MTDPQPLTASNVSGGSIARSAPAPVDDEIILGWECANPALQIERWVQDVTAASQDPC